MKTIAYGWQQEKLAENAQVVAAQGRDLYERIKVFGGHMGDLGKSLRQTVDRYNKGVGSLESRVAARRAQVRIAGRYPSFVVDPRRWSGRARPREAQAEELVEPRAEEAAE